MKNDGDVICLYSFHIIIYQNLAGDVFYETLPLDGPVRFGLEIAKLSREYMHILRRITMFFSKQHIIKVYIILGINIVNLIIEYLFYKFIWKLRG